MPIGRKRFDRKLGQLYVPITTGVTASTVIGLVGRSGSAAADRPWKITGDGSITQLTVGEYPDPLTGGINGADVFFFKRIDGKIGMFVGDNATIGTVGGSDGFLSTTVPAFGTYTSETLEAAKVAAQMSSPSTNAWNVYSTALRASARRLWVGYLSATGTLDFVAASSNDGVTFPSTTATVGQVSGAATGINLVADDAGFVAYYGSTPGPSTTLANGQMSVSFNDGSSFTQVTGGPAADLVMSAGNYATAVVGHSFGVAWDSANSRLIMAGCNRAMFAGGNHMIWTLPTGSLSSTWTAAKTNFVAAGTGYVDTCTSVTIIDSYVYVSYKRTTDDAEAHLYRAALSDLTTWTDVATLTGCTAGIADPFKLADGKLYVVAAGSGVWQSSTGASWTRILTSGSAFCLAKVA